MSSLQVSVKYDLLTRHYATNRRRRSPSPERLRGSRNGKPLSKKRRNALSADEMDLDKAMEVENEGGGNHNDGDEERRDDAEEKGEGGEDENADGKKKGGRYSKHSKGSIALKPTNMSFYPELWRKVLDLAKARMRLHVAVANAFPKIECAVDHECQEALNEVLALFEDNGWEVEAGLPFAFVTDVSLTTTRHLSALQGSHVPARKFQFHSLRCMKS